MITVTSAAAILLPNVQRAESRGVNRVPCEGSLPKNCNVGELIKKFSMKLVSRQGDAPNHGTATDGIGELKKSMLNISADAIVLSARFHQSIAIASFDTDPNSAHRVVIRNCKGTVSAPISATAIPAEQEFVL